jgi:hypothetical protein
MRDYELDDSGVCNLCGEVLSLSDPSHFALSESSAICHSCAMRYGGAYDPETERWRVPPKLPSRSEVDRSE